MTKYSEYRQYLGVQTDVKILSKIYLLYILAILGVIVSSNWLRDKIYFAIVAQLPYYDSILRAEARLPRAIYTTEGVPILAIAPQGFGGAA